MSDIIIPGISTNRNLDTDKMVEDLMAIERIPVERLEAQVDEYETQKETWQSMGRVLSALRDTSRSLYGFESPFRERIAESSDTAAVTATATRQAREGITRLEVLETAGRDRFASSPVDKEYRVPEGRYTFRVGEEDVTVRYSGGSLENFSEAINRRAGDLVETTVIPNTADTRVILFESTQEGAGNALLFEGDARPLAVALGVIGETSDRQTQPVGADPVTVQPGETLPIALEGPFTIERGMELTYDVRVIELEREEFVPPPLPPGPDTPDPGTMTFEGITIRNIPAPLDLPEPERVEPPPYVQDNTVLFATVGGSDRPLPDITPGTDFRTVRVDASTLGDRVDGFALRNRNTHRVVEVKNLRISDPSVRGDTVPLNAIDTARDARMRFSGIEIVRPTNTIDDLVPGVTVTLVRPSEDEVEINVAPDRESTKDAIIEFVGYYNQVVRDVNIYTRTDGQLIDEIEYFTDDEREQYTERLGLFQGDSSLNQLKSRLQTIMMNPYPTSAGPTVQLLAQIGISTNASGSGGGFDATRLRGYIEIDEETLDTALETNYPAIAELFGQDTDGDLIVDSGVAFSVEQFSAPYVQTGGIVSSRTDSLDTRISQAEDRIVRYNDRLVDTEARYRSEFGRMEGAMQQMQDNANTFDNLNTRNER